MTRIIKTYHDDGSIFEESQVNNKNQRHGTTKVYHENGKLRAEVNFTNDIQDAGTIISYHNNGVKAREVVLIENGVFNGDFTEWHENGVIKTQGVYENNICNIKKEFDGSGKLIMKTVNMVVNFANTVFSDLPKNSDIVELCDKDWVNFKNHSKNCIKADFKIPSILKKHMEVLKYDIDVSKAFSRGANCLVMDIKCEVTFNIKTTIEETNEIVKKIQGNNYDLTWNLSIKWQDSSDNNQYSFDSWDGDGYLELYNMKMSFFQKMQEPHLKGWHDIIIDRGKTQQILCKKLKVSMDDYDYWAKGHLEEYIPRLNLKSDNPMRLDKESLLYRIDIFNLIIEGIDGLIIKSSEVGDELPMEIFNDYHAAKASKIAAELAIKTIDKN